MVECAPPTRVTRVRFPVDAIYFFSRRTHETFDRNRRRLVRSVRLERSVDVKDACCTWHAPYSSVYLPLPLRIYRPNRKRITQETRRQQLGAQFFFPFLFFRPNAGGLYLCHVKRICVVSRIRIRPYCRCGRIVDGHIHPS